MRRSRLHGLRLAVAIGILVGMLGCAGKPDGDPCRRADECTNGYCKDGRCSESYGSGNVFLVGLFAGMVGGAVGFAITRRR